MYRKEEKMTNDERRRAEYRSIMASLVGIKPKKEKKEEPKAEPKEEPKAEEPKKEKKSK